MKIELYKFYRHYSGKIFKVVEIINIFDESEEIVVCQFVADTEAPTLTYIGRFSNIEELRLSTKVSNYDIASIEGTNYIFIEGTWEKLDLPIHKDKEYVKVDKFFEEIEVNGTLFPKFVKLTPEEESQYNELILF